jgi:hypothetical protein
MVDVPLGSWFGSFLVEVFEGLLLQHDHSKGVQV